MNSLSGNSIGGRSKRILSVIVFAACGFLLGGCGAGTTALLTCSASEVGTGTVGLTTNQTSVLISNGIGPYTVSVNGSAQESTSPEFTYTGPVTSGSMVTVVDTSNQATTSCSVLGTGTGIGTYIGGTGTVTGTGGLYVTPSPSTYAAVGTPITLMASNTTGLAGSTYTFTLESQASGVNLINSGMGEATVTSSYATTATVLVYEYTNGMQEGTATVTLTFGSGTGIGGTGNISVTQTPSTTNGSGIPVMTLTAYDTSGIGNSTFQFSLSTPGAAYLTQVSNNSATVTSTTGAPVTVMVTELEAGTTMIGSNATMVNFTNTGIYGNGYGYGYGSTACTLVATGSTTAYYSPNQPVSFYATSTTGQQLEVTSISPGTVWNGPPPSASSPSFELEYANPGSYTVSIVAQTLTQPIQTCTATTTITIY